MFRSELTARQRFVLSLCHYLYCSVGAGLTVDYVRDQFVEYFARVYNRYPDTDNFVEELDTLVTLGYLDKMGQGLFGFVLCRKDVIWGLLDCDDIENFGEWFLSKH